ncbi:putative ATP18-subunit I/j of the mitochondrial F1F0-ATP synthase [Exidia glandulosa HHB12029]|uniref:Putative ATP18-subunit I/j of the mitochondrial F1F0-ATP synthase n=1 Tax=Exidia glandulosa HHB12029 TaxID=1314781 RepID=A0A165LBU7_EXIGL|nr:putative ATP18-subunit I/j of the mitochondrial F1F0-ATP synthase [Exidia glandulosa HHB12029]
MPLFGPRKFPVPIMGPLYPFFIAAGISLYGVTKLQSLMLQTDEFKNDPRNPYAAANAKKDAH